MTKMIQIRDVPEDLHRRLKARAAQRGMSLSDYLKGELLHLAERPTLDEMLDRLSHLPPIDLRESIEDMIREDRESH